MTAAISTPKAPTPPLSSAAGGLAKVVGVVEEGREVDEELAGPPVLAAVLPAADADADAGLEALVEDAVPEEVAPEEVAEELADADLEADAVEEGVADGLRAVPEEADGVALLLAGLEALEVALLAAGSEVAGLLDGLAEDASLEVEAPGFSPIFSAFRSIVTGRLDDVEDEEGVLPGLPDVPLPLEEDVPPEDLLSVAICSPPEPFRSGFLRSQDLHYTHLVAERYRCSSDIPRCKRTTPPVLVNTLLKPVSAAPFHSVHPQHAPSCDQIVALPPVARWQRPANRKKQD